MQWVSGIFSFCAMEQAANLDGLLAFHRIPHGEGVCRAQKNGSSEPLRQRQDGACYIPLGQGNWLCEATRYVHITEI